MIDSWKTINSDFLDYLRKYENRIPKTDYGSNRMKPFFGALFEVGDLIYVTQISSAKPRHYKLKNSLDFHKYYFDNQLIGVINLNYMFPVPKQYISNLDYSKIELYRAFNNEDEKNKYIKFLHKQLVAIKKLNIEKYAIKVYQLKEQNPNHDISKRSFDFKSLERISLLYSKDESLLSYMV